VRGDSTNTVTGTVSVRLKSTNYKIRSIMNVHGLHTELRDGVAIGVVPTRLGGLEGVSGRKNGVSASALRMN
jgi:hypothetical protein